MASSADDRRNKTVTGYPAHVASGFPAGSASPYAAPPPSSSVYVHPYRPVGAPRYHLHRLHTFLCRVVTGAVTMLSVMGLIFFVTWLVLRPQLPEFRVEAVTFSPLNATGSELTATWDFTFRVTNPNNKLAVYYDQLEASVLYGDQFRLSTTQLPPFFQPKKNETTVQARFGVLQEYVGDDVVSKISENRARGSVKFGVRVFACMRFRTGAWRMREHFLRVYCEPVEIGFLRNNGTGTLKGQSKLCEVDLYLDINFDAKNSRKNAA